MVHLVRNGAELLILYIILREFPMPKEEWGVKPHLPHDWQAFLRPKS